MSAVINQFYVPSLKKIGAWYELRNNIKGGKDWRGYRPLQKINLIAGHHTVTHPTGNAEKEIATIKQIHVNGRGWGGIGYNIIITSEEVKGYAKVYCIGDIGSIRAHTPNSKAYRGLRKNYGNTYLLGVSVIGMNHLKAPTDAQYRSYHEVLKELIYGENVRMPLLRSWNDWQPHWAFDSTACYGKKLDRTKVINPPKIQSPAPPPLSALDIAKAKIVLLETELKKVRSLLSNIDKQIKALLTDNENLVVRNENLLKVQEAKLKEISLLVVQNKKLDKTITIRNMTIGILRGELSECQKNISSENTLWIRIRKLLKRMLDEVKKKSSLPKSK